MRRHDMEVLAREEEREEERLRQLPESKFFSRVGEIGAVKTTVDFASDTYAKAKNANGLVKVTLDTAERSVAYAGDVVLPIVHKFDAQIALADILACKTLDNFENSVEKSKTDGKLAGVQDFVHVTFDDALATFDQLLDQILPPNDEEKEVESNGQANGQVNGSVGTLDRVKLVGGKLHRRVIVRTQKALSHVAFAVDWLDFLKKHANSTNATIQARLSEYRAKAVALFTELSKDDPPEGDEQKAILLARLVAQRLKKIYSNIPPVAPVFTLIQTYTADLFSQITKITRIDNLSEKVVQQIRDKISLTVSLLTILSTSAFNKQS